MTDNEIIKALECCAYWESDKSCEDCPENTYGFGCGNKLSKHSLDLINRQKAEIERLTDELHRAKVEISKFFEQADSCCNEAIDVFAERLKDEMRLEDDCQYDCMSCLYACKEYVPMIDNLVKEMTEVQNEQ